MDISFSGDIRPKPLFHRCRAALTVRYPQGPCVLQVIGCIQPRGTLLYNACSDLPVYVSLVSEPRPVDADALKRRLRLWLLVLESRHIPFVCCRFGKHSALYVPVLFASLARNEITEFETEDLRQACYLPARPCWRAGGLIVAVLIFWHLLRFGAVPFYTLPVPPFPVLPTDWPQAFGLDIYRVKALGEWWRTVTALSLHADIQHLLGNAVVTGIFFSLLAGRAGVREALFLAVLGGSVGNAITVLFKVSYSISIGFSTAGFAIIGALGAYVFCDMIHLRRTDGGLQLLQAYRWFAPVVAILGFLALLGGAGQVGTNFLAHCTGLGAGFALGCCTWFIDLHLTGKGISPASRGNVSLLLCSGVLLAAWVLALR